MKTLSKTSIPNPNHIAIIMDGNGRWAQAQGLTRTEGHKKGVEAVRKTIEAAVELKIQYLTLFAFSAENWKRPKEEVSTLISLLRFYLKHELQKLHKNNIQLRILGQKDKLPIDILDLIKKAERTTAKNNKLYLNIAINYGGRQEIIAATQKIAKAIKKETLKLSEISEELFSQNLDTKGQPDPDLLIRTSGEKRISNFLLWQLAYTEMVFMDVMWPDFSKNHLEQALKEFKERNRRYGKI